VARIRLVTGEDAPALADIYRPVVESTAISFETEAPDERELRRRIESTLLSHPWLVCEHGGRVVGYAYATPHRSRAAYQWSTETSVYVRSDRSRRGVARGLYTSLFAILAAQGFVNGYAGITLPNPASVGLHESVGFRPLCVYRKVGYKLGAWHDVGWWQLVLRAYASAPEPPLKLRDIQSDPSWRAMLAASEPFVRPETRRG
jgi:L-amino acid N-acyltransferase YncA